MSGEWDVSSSTCYIDVDTPIDGGRDVGETECEDAGSYTWQPDACTNPSYTTETACETPGTWTHSSVATHPQCDFGGKWKLMQIAMSPSIMLMLQVHLPDPANIPAVTEECFKEGGEAHGSCTAAISNNCHDDQGQHYWVVEKSNQAACIGWKELE